MEGNFDEGYERGKAAVVEHRSSAVARGDLCVEKGCGVNINEAIELLQRIRGLGSRKGEQNLCVQVHRPGSIGGTPSVPVKYMFSGFDWDSGKLLISLEREVTDLTPKQVSEISESARHGQSWHAFQQCKALKAQIDQHEADAARYRYLCECKEWPREVSDALDCDPKVLIDEAIDAEIKKTREAA